MLEFLKREANITYTENGAATYATTMCDCLDLFATIGALRREGDAEITARFDRAYAENADMAMKILFFGRDIRGGLGERRVFRLLLKYIGNTYEQSAKKNIEYVAEYGRFDDLLALLDTRCTNETISYLKKRFDDDLTALSGDGSVSLLGKWLPSVNASNADTVKTGKRLARAFGLNDKEYRQALTRLRARIAILENNLRERDYSFDYSKQPSKAMFKYRKAFTRNDRGRYNTFLDSVAIGETTINVGTLLPYEIVAPFFKNSVFEDERRGIDIIWRALEDFTNGENALAVVDGSGSMYGGGVPLPASVAMSLGVYFAERNTGAFKNHFITFSCGPKLVEIKGKDIYEKIKYCTSFNEVANTDLQRVFELILNTAVKNRLPQRQMPDTLYIISDMEFDYCMMNSEVSNFENAKTAFEHNGYKMPRVVFWNVASRNRQQPVTMNEQGVALVSGASPRIFSMLKAGLLTPMAFMLATLEAERYTKITA
jgi:hypothetical protein